MLILRADRPDRETGVTAVAVRVHVAGTEADVPRAARVVGVERTGPVVAVGTNTVEARVAVPGSREEKCSAG